MSMFQSDLAKMYRKHLDMKGWPQLSADELLAMRNKLNMTEEDVKFIKAFISVWDTFESEYYDTVKGYNLDDLTVEEIDTLIGLGDLTEQDVVHFYNNEQWRDTP